MLIYSINIKLYHCKYFNVIEEAIRQDGNQNFGIKDKIKYTIVCNY